MKPPGRKTKIHFGQFDTSTEAARVVDVAFHLYGKKKLVNFEDTARIMLTRPTLAGLVTAEEKLALVKEQTDWMKEVWLPSWGSSRPSTFAPFPGAAGGEEHTLESPRGCTAEQLRTAMPEGMDETLGFGGPDEAYPGVVLENRVLTSQPAPALADGGFEVRRSNSEQNEIQRITAEFFDPAVSPPRGTLMEQRFLEIHGWVESVITADPPAVQLRHPHDLTSYPSLDKCAVRQILWFTS